MRKLREGDALCGRVGVMRAARVAHEAVVADSAVLAGRGNDRPQRSWLALAQNAAFVPQTTAGWGSMSLAAMIFGKWHPLGAFGACLLFGFLDALAIRLQGVRLGGFGEVPVPLIQALPYLLTVVLLAGFIGKARAPAELGKAYVKG